MCVQLCLWLLLSPLSLSCTSTQSFYLLFSLHTSLPLSLVVSHKVVIAVYISGIFYLSLSCSLSEGEQEEAWLTEAGLARLFDDSLAADLDQVSIINLLFK